MTSTSRQKRFIKKIYSSDVADLIVQAFEGVKITVFAYGQTGSGKTFTMMGNGQHPGLYTLTVDDIFNKKRNSQKIYVSFYEIYCSQVYDLLHERSKLILREDGNTNINVVGLMQIEVASPDELLQCIEKGNEQRITSTTSANYDSSRSHSILQIRIIENQTEVGKICFIDLAGNERGADTYDNDKQTRVDGAEINKSLLALKECIRALDQGGKHTPFRGSKLTLVLKDSFIGNCRTMMIANISPSNSCCELTLNTLRYADRVKELSAGKPTGSSSKKNEGLSDKLMLPRLDKKKQASSLEMQEDNKLEGFPKHEKPPRPIENKPLYSVQEMDKNQSGSNQLKFKNWEDRPQVSDNRNQIPDDRKRSNSARKIQNKWTDKSNSRDPKQLNTNKSKLVQESEESNRGLKSDPKVISKKRLLPIPTKVASSSSKKPTSMLPKKVAQSVFTIINKFFDKPIETYTKKELKDIHLEIIDDMIVYEENFLSDHRMYSNTLDECIKKQKKIVDNFEDPSHEIEPYLIETDKLLEKEFEITNTLKSKLEVFKRYLSEENRFAKKYICDQPGSGADKKNNSNGDMFEIRSHESLLLDD